ncbi:MAG: hypothetical protein CL515_02495 [Actinobacteria bacterium]|nr:hypothetical protein [Actinomycetota bacterium]|tara:strand:- start:2678 stop:3097 length:420 start_codon:yes stop_codon:yes gene_type:complete
MNSFFEEIQYSGERYAIVLNTSESPEGLSFITQDSDYIQAGMWNYKKGTNLPAHYHNYFERVSYRTSEAVYVVEGKVECKIFTEEGEPIWEGILNKGQLIIQLQGAHKYTILEDAIVVETKNGPYFGAEVDRTRIENND